MANNRTSDLNEILNLSYFDESIVSSQYNENQTNTDDDVLFMVANPEKSNEKIKYKNLKKSILDTSVLLTGQQDIHGSKTFLDNCTFAGGLTIDSYFIEEYIYHKDDPNTKIHFDTEEINFFADDSINLNVSGNNSMSINSNGSVSINSDSYSGHLNVNGSAYFDDLYILGGNNQFTKVSPFPEESVHFTLPLVSGYYKYNIDLPKTFENPPAVSVEVQGSNPNAVVQSIPHLITSVSNHDLSLQFAAPIPNDLYSVHVLAKPTGESQFRQTKTVSLTENLQQGSSSFTINYPEAFHAPPILSTSLESNQFIVPYLITESTESSFKVVFTSELPTDMVLHIHATR